ncbi:MAG: hypothetical protein K8I29_09765 [Alphaproteobacteria bacterium]|uniref:Uncharacterized protein n=1 Tax=Candidatus Nitrobium versatile TaxID=2884831 RepID=A0A953J524_9BACT|nr:hypothetical protein [Candidatus Nitrobium versatile]
MSVFISCCEPKYEDSLWRRLLNCPSSDRYVSMISFSRSAIAARGFPDHLMVTIRKTRDMNATHNAA